MERVDAERLFETDRATAWDRYIADTRELHGIEYEEVEPHVHARLCAELDHARALLAKRAE